MFTPPVTRGPVVGASVWSAPWLVGGVAIGVDKFAVTRPVPKVRPCPSSWAGGSSTAARNAADGNVGRQLQAEPCPAPG